MKRFTGHTEKWGTFLDVKNWPRITDPHKYDGQRIVIGSVTDGYNEHEATYKRTRMLLENTSLSIDEIAERIHYADSTTFGRFFFRMKGVTPREYRKRSYF